MEHLTKKISLENEKLPKTKNLFKKIKIGSYFSN
jgi:hypothetical protein